VKTAIICDLDNTLSLNVTGRRWYGEGYESRLFEDEVNETVNNVLAYLTDKDEGLTTFADHILFVSGRMEVGRAETVRWLTKKARQYEEDYTLLMRADKDFRLDEVVKREIYGQHIRGKYDVRLVLDDKPALVGMWRALGLQCWQVREYE
jgi:hypothetical protein